MMVADECEGEITKQAAGTMSRLWHSLNIASHISRWTAPVTFVKKKLTALTARHL